MAAVAVLLVDGFGNWTLYERKRDCLTIVYKDRSFEKTDRHEAGLEVYQLVGYPPPPEIRHVQVIAHILRPRLEGT